MKTTLFGRKSFLLAVIIPAFAAGAILSTGNETQAQQQSAGFSSYSPKGGGGRSNGKSQSYAPTDGIDARPGIPLCPPGTAPTPNCRAWTPPRTIPVAKSEDDCSCTNRYITVNGLRVATRDCYVLLPSKRVHYCQANIRR